MSSADLSANYSGIATESGKLRSIRMEDLNMVNSAQQIGTLFSGQEKTQGVVRIVYSSELCQFLRNDGQLNNLLNKTPGLDGMRINSIMLDIIYIHSTGKLDIVMGSFGATDVMQSSLLNGNFIKSNTLIQFMSAGNLQLVDASALNISALNNAIFNSLVN